MRFPLALRPVTGYHQVAGTSSVNADTMTDGRRGASTTSAAVVFVWRY